MDRSPVMIGRRAERERTSALLRALAAGRGGALCVIGPPGAGKSRLLAALEEDAAGLVDVHRAAPVQAEHPLAFAAVADLVTPLLGDDGALPAGQREALRSALALDGPPEPPALAILTAVLGLFDAAARRRPQLVLVDDAHALDLASLPAVGFLARRAGLRALGVVLAARPEGDDLAELEGIPRLPLGDLAPDEARELLTLHGCAPAVSAQVAAELGGNPLALTEASAALRPEQRAGRTALPDPLPVGRTLEATYARRVDALPAAGDPRRAARRGVGDDERRGADRRRAGPDARRGRCTCSTSCWRSRTTPPCGPRRSSSAERRCSRRGGRRRPPRSSRPRRAGRRTTSPSVPRCC